MTSDARRRELLLLVVVGISSAAPRSAEASPAAVLGSMVRKVIVEAMTWGSKEAFRRILGDRWQDLAAVLKPVFAYLTDRVQGADVLDQEAPPEHAEVIAARMIELLKRDATIDAKIEAVFQELDEGLRSELLERHRILENRLTWVERRVGALEERVRSIEDSAPHTAMPLRRERKRPRHMFGHLGHLRNGTFHLASSVPCSPGQTVVLHVHLPSRRDAQYEFRLREPNARFSSAVRRGETKSLSIDGTTTTLTGLLKDTDLVEVTSTVEDGDLCGSGYSIEAWVNGTSVGSFGYELVAQPLELIRVPR